MSLVELPKVYCPKEKREVPVWCTLSETDRAYLAGLIDGDGTICFSTQNRLRYKWKTPRLDIYPIISIYGNSKAFLESIKQILGFGRVNVHSKKGFSINKGYSWKVNKSEEVLRMSNILEPYLKIKKRQCELMIEYCKSKLGRKSEWRKPQHRSYPKRELEIVQEITALNQGEL